MSQLRERRSEVRDQWSASSPDSAAAFPALSRRSLATGGSAVLSPPALKVALLAGGDDRPLLGVAEEFASAGVMFHAIERRLKFT
jgi:hypothetical protein